MSLRRKGPDVKINIDGTDYDAQPGQTVLDVARANGIYIPTLCYHARTGRAGRCRACVVEAEGIRGLKAACVLEVQHAMVIRTDTPAVMNTRRTVVELLLAGGKHNCLACESNGDCELQDMAYKLGIEKPKFLMETTDLQPDLSAEGIVRDLDKCILCGRCVASCNNNVMHEVLDFGWRGDDVRIVCDNNKPMGDSSCVQCGECVQVCPVGALTFKTSKGKARNWEVEKKRVICPYCGVGCVMEIAVRDNEYLWATAVEENCDNLPNKGMLCVKGRFGLDYLNRPDRLTTPMIRKNGKLEEATWDEALEFAAARLQQVKQEHGPGAVGCFSSAKTTNEENFAMMRFARAVIGTNNVDHCARLCHSSTVAGLATTLGSGAMTNSMQEAQKSDVILVTGSNTTWCHPVFGGMIKHAVKQHGVRLIVVDPRKTDLAKIAHLHLRQRNGSDVAWLMGVQRIIINEGWHNQAYIDERCEGWGEYRASLEFFTPEKVEELSGISKDDLHSIAKLYATGGVGALYFSMGITQHTHGTDNVKACANLAMITGNLGVEGGGVNPLRGQSNVQGACDMGALPNVFSGYQKVTDETIRNKFAEHWGIDADQMHTEIGHTVTTMIEACGDDIKALYVMGENPMMSDANLNHVEKQLKKLDLLIVQDIFLTETAQMADVVLPAAAFAEKTGTYTNTERRVQVGRAALTPPKGTRQDYEIIADIAARLGHETFPRTPAALFDEIKRLTPSYHGMTYERLEPNGLRWPCPTEDHPGTPILHVDKFVRGKGLLTPLQYKPSAEEPDSEYPMCLSTGRMLEHFHSGSMTRRCTVLDGIAPRGEVEVNPADAERIDVRTGDKVRVETRRGTIDTHATVTDTVSQGLLYIPFHFVEAAANRLTNDALDPVSKIPEYKICAARISKAE
ncbi:MAG: formate dehydrogenase subunit alpha [Planctomycetes bacterium]|nr:formate dehydrogenase subunit alpha [Planctomycetota bacterium]